MNIIGRLARAIEQAQADESIMERQVARMRSRTAMGVDIRGTPFKPFARPPRHGQSRPLVAGPRLIDRARIDVAKNSLSDVDLRATISGEAGKIAFYQNKRRQFWGYSEHDRDAVIADFIGSIRKNLK